MGLLNHSNINTAVTEDGAPLSGAQRIVYRAGTNFLAALYQDPGLTYLQANPAKANDQGEFDLCYLLDGDYDVTVKSALGTVVAHEPAVSVRTVQSFGADHGFRSIDLMMADRIMSYEPKQGRIAVAQDQVVWSATENFLYRIAPSSTGDHDQITQGGVKLYALPTPDGGYNVRAFGAKGDGIANDTAAFVSAAGQGGRKIIIPPGTYLVEGNNNAGAPTLGTFNIPSGTTLEGGGIGSTIIKPFNPTARGAFSADGGRGAGTVDENLIENVVIRGMTFQGAVLTEGHGEGADLCNFSGVDNWLVEDCEFRGARADGINWASGNSSSPEHARRNTQVTIRKCVFDGELNGADGGRNAMTISDMDGMLIEDCVFRRWSRRDMPGSLCFEPGGEENQVKNITIRQCRFTDCAGTRGHVALSFDNCANDAVQNITVASSYFNGSFASGTQAGRAIWISTDKDATDFPTVRQNVRVVNNVAEDVSALVDKQGGHLFGLYIENNSVTHVGIGDNRVVIGDQRQPWVLRDFRFSGNRLVSAAPQCLSMPCNVEQALIKGNVLDGAAQEAIAIGHSAMQSICEHIYVEDNVILGSPSAAFRVFGAYDWSTGAYFRNNGAVAEHNFAVLKTDFCGNRFNVHTFDMAPEAFPFGESQFRVEGTGGGANGPSGGTNYGLVRVVRHTNRQSAATSAIQYFFPDHYAGGYVARNDGPFQRKQTSAGTWGAWRKTAMV